MDAATIGRDDCCELGKWLHGSGRSRCGNKPAFVALINAHKAFHQEAGKVAQMINQGAGSIAEGMLASGTGFSKASSEVTRIIVQLRKECEGGAAAPTRAASTAPKLTAKASVPATATPSIAGGADDEWETF